MVSPRPGERGADGLVDRAGEQVADELAAVLGGAVQVRRRFEAGGELGGQLRRPGRRRAACPTRPSTTATAITGSVATPATAMPALRTSPSSPIATAAATPTWAKSPWRPATSKNAAPLRVGHGGTRIAVSSSSGPTAVVK